MKLINIKQKCIILLLVSATKLVCQNTNADTLYPFKIIKNEKEKNSLVIFNNTNSPYYVTDKKNTDELKSAISKHEPVRIEYDANHNIVLAQKIVKSNQELFLDKHDTLVFKKFLYTKELSLKKNDKNFKNEVIDALPELKKEIPLDSVSVIFKALLELSCEKVNTCDKNNPCITFDYKEDGCYARAHWMRKLLDEKYGYTCEKIFVYGNLKANNAGNCGSSCIKWSYHVAPYIQAISSDGKKQGLVLDPSLFDHAVSITEWISAQEKSCCSGCTEGKHDSYEIKPGYQYFPSGATDLDYDKSLKILRKYCRRCR